MNQYSYTQVVNQHKSLFNKPIGLLILESGELLFVTSKCTEKIDDIANIQFQMSESKILIKSGENIYKFSYPAVYRNYEKNVRPLFEREPNRNQDNILRTSELLNEKINQYTAGQYLDGKVPNKIAAILFEASGAKPF